MKIPQVNRPLVFAHRGARRVAPENTLPAFQAALDMGVDGIELDVRYSSDGRLIIMHNPELDETTNGQGLVHAHTFEELRQLDASGHFGAQFAGTRIPTLDEALDLLAGRCLVNIEIKSAEMRTIGMGREVIAAVRNHKMADQVVVSSFNPFALRPLRSLAPEIETGYLMAEDLPGWMRSGIARRYSRAGSLHPHFSMVDAAYMESARKRQAPVRVWTVNEEADVRRMARLGVAAIISDVPDQALALLA